MRKLTGSLEQNPMLQAIVLGGLALLLGVLLYVRVLSGGASSTEPAPSVPAPASTATPPPGSATDSPAPGSSTAGSPAPSESAPEAPSADATPAEPVPAGPSAGGSTMAPGPGLPAKVSRAYRHNKVVVLSIFQRGGLPSHVNLRYLRALQKDRGVRNDVAIFEFEVSKISRYARITQGVDVNRAPAMVVVRPESLNAGETPKASVRYGYMGGRSAAQAVFDAAYSGPDLPYYAE